MNVLFVISALRVGGAEMMLYKLIRQLSGSRLRARVLSIGREERPGRLIRELGVEVVSLDLPSAIGAARAPLRIRRLLRGFKPQVIQGWMYHGNLVAWMIAASSRSRIPLIWNIRQTLYDLSAEKWLTRHVIRAGARLSRHADRILYVSRLSRTQHQAVGYCDDAAQIIPNGFDLDLLRRDEASRSRIRGELGAQPDTLVIGHLARFHPMKDQAGLIAAAGKVLQAHSEALFVLAGPGLTPQNTELTQAAAATGFPDRIRFIGEVSDTPGFLSACDIFCLSSAWGEGFPNSIGEAMACELPCVATRVGDTPDIVSDCGVLIEPRDPRALAEGILHLARMDVGARRQLGLAARKRIQTLYSIDKVAADYGDLFDEIAAQKVT
jgi:glycosyltransferase involved in cell wall biosynthesis